MNEGIRFSELLSYNQLETSRWKDWFRAHPAALDAPCDIAGGKTVSDLLFHIFAVELSFAHSILGLPKPVFNSLPHATLDELFEINQDAARKIQNFLDDSKPEQWSDPVSIGFREVKATPRKMLAQAFLHGVQHRGQLAVILRQQGFKDPWVHDIVMTDVMK